MVLEDRLDHLLSIDIDTEKEDLKLEFNQYCLDKQCYKCENLDIEDRGLTKALCLLDYIIDNYKLEKRRN